jgi:hypothetical protein
MSDFLGLLGNAISSQFGLATSDTTSLNEVIDGQQLSTGSLGGIASQFDQSIERRYTEEGYLRRDPYETDPRLSEVLWQQPSATVLFKKKMFSSIAENYRPDFMDQDEKLYYKAMCLLFQNKCTQIAALEQLSKISQVTAAVGSIAQQLLPVIVTLADQANNGYATGSGTGLFPNGNPFAPSDATSFFQTVDRLRVLQAYNFTSSYTSWITDPTDLFQSTFGPGTGVIEITNFTSLNTTTSVDILSPGGFTLSISDPYESMLITDYDIEIALSDATNAYYNNQAISQGVVAANQTITQQQNMLNQARSSRNASPISFNVDPNTILGQPITAIIDSLGLEIPFTYNAFGGLIGSSSAVSVPADYLRGGNLAGYNGLDDGTLPIGPDSNIVPLFGSSELSLFNAIITATFQQLTLLQNTSTNYVAQNQLTNYARKKLRFNFSGLLIIQPMDTVHIYMNSRSQYDAKVLSGLQQMFSGVGILGNLNDMATSLVNQVDTLLNPSGNIAMQAEKSIYVGPDFPNYLWALLRTQFVTEIEGTHVFAGVVEHANDNWADGKFTMNIDGKDNTAYFDQGKINFKPGVDAFNGLIFDPLTPFKSNFDSFTGNASAPVTSQNSSNTPQLLDENMYLLSETASGSLVRYKQGALFGEKATQGNYIQDQNIDPATGRLTKIFYAPDGLVYKWKQGIGIFAQSGSTATLNDPNLVGNPNIFNEPFAGLDVMNVLSLLIAGVPYNYATYFKATSNFNGFTGDPNSKQSNSNSFMDSLRLNLVKTNTLWGNFIPFKTLTMNEAAIAQSMQAQFTATQINSDLDKKLQQFSNYQTQLVALGAINALSNSRNISTPAESGVLAQQKSTLLAQVTNLQTSIQGSIQALQAASTQFSSQTGTGPADATNYLTNGTNDPSDSQARKTIRREINYLTRRMSYDVRANEDKNLFIVDDYYDVDYDIAAFNSSLTDGLKLYSNTYTSARENIQTAADLLNLEVFADSQGHIRVRPPQYNRMPSSVFYRMLYLKQTLGIQVFPDFLNNLLTNQLSSLQTQIEILEDQIRLDCAILNQYPSLDVTGDQAAQIFLVSFNPQGATFGFLSNGATDSIGDINNLVQQANQDVANAGVSQGLGDYSIIKAAGTSTKQLFTNAASYTYLLSALTAQNQAQGGIQGGTNVNNQPTTGVFQSSLVQTLITRISTKSGQTVSSSDYLTAAGPNQPLEIATGQTIDFFKVTSQLTTYMMQWQTQVKLFYHTLKNTAEYRSLDDDTTTGNTMQNAGIFNNQNIPEVYEHMIEDETYDDYGLNSGQRYVIKTSQIKNLAIGQNAPPWTTVQVEGTLSPLFDPASGGGGPAGFNNFPGGGNGLVTALAIDYDMWRNYGFKDAKVIRVPFLTDPVTQCGPYAAMVLARNRSNILQGTCTISGNEFMQVGEVVYLEDRNLLFYIKSVKHNYTEGQSFTTSLDLIYGHSIGEYIPTYLDTVGKLIYKNQDVTNTVIQRQDSSANEKNLGIIQLSGQQPTANILYTGSEDDNINSYSATNQTVINNILYTTNYVINSNGQPGNNVTAAIELRIYYDSNTPVNSNLQSMAQQVQSNLLGSSQGVQSLPTTNQPTQNQTLPAGSVTVVTVSMDSQTEYRSPSQQAINAARNQMANTSTNTGPSTPTSSSSLTANNTTLRTNLYSYIIDCWITFTPVPATVSSSSTANPVA